MIEDSGVPWWLTEGGAVSVHARWNGFPTVAFTTFGDGSARLRWVFDDDDVILGMLTHLSADEAFAVLSAAPGEGLLERVRDVTRPAYLWAGEYDALAPGGIRLRGYSSYLIPSHGTHSEAEYTSEIDDVMEALAPLAPTRDDPLGTAVAAGLAL